VAGHAIVKMADLRDTFAAAGCRNVRTYIQSGNVVFECSAGAAASNFNKLRANLRGLIGSEPGVMFRTVEELQTILQFTPFKSIEADGSIKLYVTFLCDKPRTIPQLPLVSSKEALEAIDFKGREVFIVSRRKPNGFYGFPNNFIEKEFGVLATSRNWSTVTKLVEFARQSR
jgi:uncharacterized protein (DUF1697 family)